MWFGFRYLQGSSKTVVGAINKGMNGVSLGPVNIVKEVPVNGGEVVFYIRDLADNGIALDMRFVKKTFDGWKVTNYGGEMGGSSIAYHPSEQAIKAMPILQMYLPKTNGVNLNPMIVGTIADPSISEIVIRNKSGLKRKANIIKVNDAFRIFYNFVSENAGNPYNLIVHNSDGIVTKSINMDITARSSSVIEKVNN